MTNSELITKIEEIEMYFPDKHNIGNDLVSNSFYILAIQFIKTYLGENSEFYTSIKNYKLGYTSDAVNKAYTAQFVLEAVKNYLKLNLNLEINHNYQIKIDVISDFIEQSINLANDKNFHPASSAILLGASLEEFLKQLAEKNDIILEGNRLSIDTIAKKLYEVEIITKQDFKDITSWAGLRNDATHGNFEEVNDRKRILNAIEGVNLFMRKYN